VTVTRNRPAATVPVGALRMGSISVRVSRRPLITGIVMAIAVAGTVLVACFYGDYPIPAGEVVKSLLGQGAASTDFVVIQLRLPRALCAVVVGAALGASGAAFQALTRNPLGSPDIIGFTSGAATGALLQILVVGGTALAVSAGALVGGLVSALIVYLLAMGRGAVGYRLVLVGIGLNALLWAINSYLLITAKLEDALSAQVWLVGSLNGRSWDQLWPVVGMCVLCLPLLMIAARPLGLLEMGDDAAKALGVRADRTRIVIVILAVALAAAATATAGPIAFVALAAPQLAKRVTGSVAVGVLPAALMGAFVLATSDFVAQRLFAPVQLPVGIVTGCVGGLYLISLLLTEWKKGRG
jgi:iron-siderophore transport system permease protein